MILKKENISRFVDSILIFAVTCFFCTAAASYFVKGFYSVVFAGIAGGMCLLGIITLLQKKRTPLSNPKIKETMLQFIYNEPDFAYNFVRQALESKFKTLDMQDYLMVNSTAIFVHLKNGRINGDILATIYGKVRKTAKRIIILTVDGADSECTKLIHVLPCPIIEIFDAARTYSFLNWLGRLPAIEIELKKTSTNIRSFFSNALTPSRARGYFFAAFTLIIPSLIFKNSLYYIAAAMVCITLGTLAKINLVERIKKKTAPKNIAP